MIAVLFAGHGAEHPGMGQDWVGPGSALVELAGSLAGFDAGKLLRRGGPSLHHTQVVQPLLTAVNLTILAALAQRGLAWQLCMGHSLGELAAWSASGAITASDAVTLAARRGAILAELARAHPGAMLALRFDLAGATGEAEAAKLDEALALGRAHGVVDPAVHNGPGQWVLSGQRPALAEIAKRFGGSFVATDGAWHSRLMAAGVAPFRVAVEAAAANAQPRSRGIITNQDGCLCRPEQDFVAPFVAQMTDTVRWVACLRTLAKLEVRDAVLVGPSKALAGSLLATLGAKIDAGALRVHRVETRRELDAVVELLA
ncbi:Malonyl CoA-acyl carrier protein transacylase [Enhygromyxa salina]|uniref:[acyl-carrier-protein] S-malonyltransferase n=1 Tax=Enhygromyxa salina TaxID=215803 RepID=A0A0C1ZNL1_9BACT|nr:Malonyl CoA-acyl carrier protein transacylase [Enhygromyxa salina]